MPLLHTYSSSYFLSFLPQWPCPISHSTLSFPLLIPSSHPDPCSCSYATPLLSTSKYFLLFPSQLVVHEQTYPAGKSCRPPPYGTERMLCLLLNIHLLVEEWTEASGPSVDPLTTALQRWEEHLDQWPVHLLHLRPPPTTWWQISTQVYTPKDYFSLHTKTCHSLSIIFCNNSFGCLFHRISSWKWIWKFYFFLPYLLFITLSNVHITCLLFTALYLHVYKVL